mgnify:FL=1
MSEQNLYQVLAKSHTSLRRGRVWCRECGHSEAVNSVDAFEHGWPKHCGYTMTIDSPEEQAAFATQQEQE